MKRSRSSPPSVHPSRYLTSVGVTASSIKAIATNCPALSKLSIGGRAGCENITTGAFKAIATNCTALEALSIGGCENLTNEGVKAIIEKCPLKSLGLAFLGNLTDEGIKAIAANSPSLRLLFIITCFNLTSTME